MKKIQKKHFYIAIVVILISFIVILLYPVGKRLLTIIRAHDHQIVYGKEIIYSYIDSGDIKVADEILQNKYTISRFEPVTIDKISWNEDPFSDIYWRFNYYNLEPVRNLLFAWEKTGSQKYKDRLIEITESFIDNGVNGPYSWDYHGTAFRTMTLIDVREKLRVKNELPDILDKKILETLKIHGNFLADPTHFEKDYNHGLDQATALYLLAVNFPDMKGSDTWLKLSSERIVEMQKDIIDQDGILIENSPYYHLYVLEKFLEIDKYLKQNHLVIDGFSEDKINKMISYVVYMLQPDLTVPTIGASIERGVNLFGLYKEIAESHPDLLYVLSQGKQGQKPSSLNVQYPISGETIMRSGWGKGKDYADQTQLIFDVGNYRTNHSDLDALSFNLFGGGIALMPDAGLYTYEDGPYRSYFHGTRSHNTVVVDGKDQDMGNGSVIQSKTVIPGFFEEGDSYVYQSGEHSLYEGVSHERAIAMIEDSTILIFDNLRSDSEHTYEQMFHLFPGAKISTDGLTLNAKGDKPEQSLAIKQFVTDGLELHTAIGQQNPPDGLCSFEYKVAVPCYSISYTQKGKNVSYITAISIGQNLADISISRDNNYLMVKTNKGEYNIKINKTENIERSIEVKKNFDISQIYSSIQPADSLNTLSEWQKTDGTLATTETTSQKSAGSWVYNATTGEQTFTPLKENWTLNPKTGNWTFNTETKTDAVTNEESVKMTPQLSAGSWIYDPITGKQTFVPTKENWAFNQNETVLNTINKKSPKINGGSLSVNNNENSLEIITPKDGSYFDTVRNTNLDLSNQNIYFKIKVDKMSDLSCLDFYLSNDNWKKEAIFDVEEVTHYQNISRDEEWIQFGVGKGDLRKIKLGNWKINDPTFDWSKIDSIKFITASKGGKSVTIDIKDFSLVPDQKEARAVIVFDDGWASVMDAAEIMNKYGFAGNVGIITGSVGKNRYLTLDNLKALQNDYGWNIASHSSLHKPAVQTYVDNNNLTGLDNDVSDALQYLIQNNINSVPNWYIYPDGSTDSSVKKIIGKYYKFARATNDAPQLFPFGEPLEVGIFPVYSDRTEPVDVHNAISDAIKYKQTIFLMFHKLSKEAPSVYTEYSLKNFDKTIKDIKDQGIKVVTLSEFDSQNNIPQTEFILHKAVPLQYNLDITASHVPNKMLNVIMNKWKEFINFGNKIIQKLNLLLR
jgi:hypothetical protein